MNTADASFPAGNLDIKNLERKEEILHMRITLAKGSR